MRVVGLLLAVILLLPSPAYGQRGQQIFDLFLQGAQEIERQQHREFQRQQQREFERQQRQDHKRMYDQYVSHWQACQAGHVPSCDMALAYPNLSTRDRQILLTNRQQILTAEREAADRANRERLEAERQAAERAYRERLEAEAEERRRRQHEREIAERQRAEEAQRAHRTAVLGYSARADDANSSSAAWVWLALAGIGLAGGALGVAAARWYPTIRSRLADAETTSHAAADTSEPPTFADPPSMPAPPPPRVAPSVRDTPGAVAAMELRPT